MERPIEFSKLSGSGNDFICIDNRDGRFDDLLADPARAGRFARAVCRRGLAVGADGIIFACGHDFAGLADVAAQFFEPDGSQAELCGNGTACFTRWVLANGWVSGSDLRILTPAGVVRGCPADGQYVRVCIPLPQNVQRDQRIDLRGSNLRFDYAVTGVPHAIVYVDDVNETDVAGMGSAVRRHPRFAPRGVNANFVQVLGEGRLAVRTFEFGVEAETLACGTGCAASAILAALRFNWPHDYLRGQRPILVSVRSGDVLRVYFAMREDGGFTDLCLESVVRFLYTARLHSDLAQEALGQASSNG